VNSGCWHGKPNWPETFHQLSVCLYISQTVLDTTRTVFGLHKEGYMFPMLLNVKPMENSFSGVIAPLYTATQFILFTNKTFAVKSATKESYKLFDVRRLLDPDCNNSESQSMRIRGLFGAIGVSRRWKDAHSPVVRCYFSRQTGAYFG
jgi:hypothetical protein